VKRIIVLQIPNSKNNGSAMMAINSINFFDSEFEGDVEFCCDFSSDEDRERIGLELNPKTKISTLSLPVFERGANLFSSFINRQKWIKEVIDVISEKKPLVILVLGGDDFSEYYSGYKIIVRLYFMYRLSLHFPVYLIGHTIGPFSSWRKSAFRFLMSKCRIVTRDAISLEHCQKDLKHKYTEQGHDLAWFDLPNQTRELKDRMLNKYELYEDDFIIITPSALVKHYAEKDEDYFSSFGKLLETLREQGRKIVFIPHVFSDTKRDDRWIISEIKKQYPDFTNVTYIEDMLLPSEFRAIASSCHFSIACRMHAAVSTLQTGRPSIALSYSAKYAGVIGGDMGLPELVVEAADKELWKDGLAGEIKAKIDSIEINYGELISKIQGNVILIKVDQARIMSNYAREMVKGRC